MLRARIRSMQGPISRSRASHLPTCSPPSPLRAWWPLCDAGPGARARSQTLRMLRDHQLFTGRNDPRGDPAAHRADARTALLVRRAVELQPQPCRVAADPFPEHRAVFPDAGREHERIESAERGRERAQLAPDPVDVEVHGELRPG